LNRFYLAANVDHETSYSGHRMLLKVTKVGPFGVSASCSSRSRRMRHLWVW